MSTPAAGDRPEETTEADGSTGPWVLTFGKFDGVHAGHRHLVERVLDLATATGARSAALVLYPDPAVVLHGATEHFLCSLPERLDRLAALGVDHVDELRFTADLARLSPEDFARELSARYELRTVVVGPDFAFGHQRSGDLGTLRSIGDRRGFEVDVCPPLLLDGRRVSSGTIREMVARGDVASAAQLLERPPHVRGLVVMGRRRGREMGYPTANLAPTGPYVVPADGVYAVRCRWRREPGGQLQDRDGAASIGLRPTFESGSAQRTIEAFVLDFEGDLYGHELRLDFVARLRGEKRFESVDDLVRAMEDDVRRSRVELAAFRGRAGRRVRGAHRTSGHS